MMQRFSLNKAYLKPLFAYLLWIFVGTAFYALQMGNTATYFKGAGSSTAFGDPFDVSHQTSAAARWQLGFFMAVNVGYCIGWHFPGNANAWVKIFSIMYMLIGASAVATALAYFAQMMIESSKNWYLQALEEKAYRQMSDMHFTEKWWRWLTLNHDFLRAMGLWLSWLAALVVFVMNQYPSLAFLDAMFFALSSLTSAGLESLPEGSSSGHYFVLAVLAATGVPVTALAMSNVANVVLKKSTADVAMKTIEAKVTAEEVVMMQRFGLDNGSGRISKGEYILLCAVRLGALSPELVGKINERFNKLDVLQDGCLSYAELTENKLLLKKQTKQSFEMGLLSAEEYEETSRKLGIATSAENAKEEEAEAVILQHLSSRNSLQDLDVDVEDITEEQLEMMNLIPGAIQRV